MATYEWTGANREEYDPLGHTPIWFTIVAPKLVLSVPSPSADPWRLVRLEAAATIQIDQVGAPLLGAPYAEMAGFSPRLLAEVYPFGSTSFPSPIASPAVRSVWSGILTPRVFATDSHTAGAGVAMYSTDGYVTSRGERGPADYGGGQAQVNFGVWTAFCDDAGWPGVANCAFYLGARALWKLG